MGYRVLADLVVALHLAFVVFVACGGLLALRWPRVAWAHVPAAVWGVTVELAGWVCPLTPLENALRERAGLAPYSGDFVARYVLPVLYPGDLTRALQLGLGVGVLVVNGAIYGWMAWRWRRRKSARGPEASPD